MVLGSQFLVLGSRMSVGFISSRKPTAELRSVGQPGRLSPRDFSGPGAVPGPLSFFFFSYRPASAGS